MEKSNRTGWQTEQTASISRLHWYHWLVVSASLLLTLFAWYISKSQTEEKLQQRFEFQTTQLLELIEERMSRYEDALRSGVAAIYSQTHGIDILEWRRFADTLKIHQSYPGINGIGVIYYVVPDQLNAYLEKERLLRPDYRIHPSHQRGEYWPITFIAPLESNAQAVGLDIAFEDNRYHAAIKARDSHSTQITAPIILVQDEQHRPGFLQYVPFYQEGPLATVGQRRQNFIGLVYAPFIMYKLIQGTLEQKNRQLLFRVSDGEQVLYDELNENNPHYDANPMYSQQITVEMYGRPWRYQIQTAQSFREGAETFQSIAILLGGISIDAMLLLLFMTLARSNQRAVWLADKLTCQLRIRESYYRQIIESAPCGLVIIASDGRIETANPKAQSLFDYRNQPMDGLPFISLIADGLHAELQASMEHLWQQAELTSINQVQEIICQTRAGQRFPAELGLAQFEGENGVKLLATIMDMSAYVEITDELRRSNKELKDFAYIASHDLKAPLHAIMRLSNWIAEDMAGIAAEDSLRNLALLTSRTQRLQHLLDDLLAYSRIGRLVGDLRLVNSGELVRSAFELNDHPPGFRLHLADPLPTFVTLAVPLETILRNLLSNAVKHHDKPQGHIRVSVKEQDQHYQFSLCDDGPGIAPAFQHKVFELFKTLKPRDEVEGSGIGLSIVKKMVEFHGGRIWIESDGRRGSCFVFTWPKDLQKHKG